jgi:hypothetical protein
MFWTNCLIALTSIAIGDSLLCLGLQSRMMKMSRNRFTQSRHSNMVQSDVNKRRNWLLLALLGPSIKNDENESQLFHAVSSFQHGSKQRDTN